MAKKIDADVRKTTLLKHVTKINKAQTEKSELGSEVQAAHKAAKSDGINLDGLKLAMRLHKKETAEGKAILSSLNAYLEMMGSHIVAQGDLVEETEADPATESAEEAAAVHQFHLTEIYSAGLAAGRAAQTGQHDHNYAPGTEEADTYERAWLDGQAQNAPKKLEGESTAVTVAPKRGRRKAPALDPIEDFDIAVGDQIH